MMSFRFIFAIAVVILTCWPEHTYGQARGRPELAGKVLLPSGQPANGVQLALGTDRRAQVVSEGVLRSSGRGPENRSGPDGSFRFQLNAIDRDVHVVAVHDAGTAVITEVELRRTRTIRLQPWTSVTGIVREADRVLSDEPIRYFNGAKPQPHRVIFVGTTKSGADGRFRFERIPVGDFEIGRD